MPGFVSDATKKLSSLVELYYTIDSQQKELISDVKRLEQEFASIRVEHVRLESRLTKLEAGQDKIQAEVRLEIERAINQIQMQYMSSQLDAARAQNALLLTSSQGTPAEIKPQGIG